MKISFELVERYWMRQIMAHSAIFLLLFSRLSLRIVFIRFLQLGLRVFCTA